MAEELTDTYVNVVYADDYIIKSNDYGLFRDQNGEPYVIYSGVVRKIDGGYFVKLVEAIAPLNQDESLDHLRFEIANKRVKYA